MVIYTNGVVEARSPDGSFFGEKRLASLLRSSISLDARTLADLVESAILDFQENDPRDDIAYSSCACRNKRRPFSFWGFSRGLSA
ncbi:MAG: serine/threonine-protein phosphatase, partial [Actinomycetota bacterium]|nr:serine/threonine-protein phosphatase [Actinomycetota bacterium]